MVSSVFSLRAYWFFSIPISLVHKLTCTGTHLKYMYMDWWRNILNFRYLESKPQHWRPAHSVAVKEIEDVNKMTMALYISHTINFQNYGDKTSRRTDLILELKKIFEELNIKYHLLPQEIYLTKVGSATTELPPSWRWQVLIEFDIECPNSYQMEKKSECFEIETFEIYMMSYFWNCSYQFWVNSCYTVKLII